MKTIFVEISKDAFFSLYDAERAEYGLPPIPEDARERVWDQMRRNLVIGEDSLIADCSDHDLQLLRAAGYRYRIIKIVYEPDTEDESGESTAFINRDL